MSNIKTGWLKDNLGDKFAPKTLSSQVMTADGSNLETKINTNLDNAVAEAKSYTDEAAAAVKNDLLNGAGEAYDTLKELGDLIDENQDALEALETVATGKAEKEHIHAISDVAELQGTLDTNAGKIVAGQTFVVDGVEKVAREGAEIFNHYSGNIATGSFAHAEGWYSIASGTSSHAEGNGTRATRYAAHAEGETTIATGLAQHVQGQYNIPDNDENGNPLDQYAHIVGNGDWETPSNAHTLDWEGNANFAGDVYVGNANENKAGKKLATEEYADSQRIAWTERNIFTFDGNTSEKVSDQTQTFYKVSDKTPDINTLIRVKGILDGTDTELPKDVLQIIEFGGGAGARMPNGGTVFAIVKDPSTVSGFSEPGLYFPYYDENTYVYYIEFDKIIHTIDPKYLPKGGFGYSEQDDVYIVESPAASDKNSIFIEIESYNLIKECDDIIDLSTVIEVTGNYAENVGMNEICTNFIIKKKNNIQYLIDASNNVVLLAVVNNKIIDNSMPNGLYRYKDIFGYVTSIKFKGTVHRINPKYLPEGGFGYSESIQADLHIPESTDIVPDASILGYDFKWFSNLTPTLDEFLAGSVTIHQKDGFVETYKISDPTLNATIVKTATGAYAIMFANILIAVSSVTENELGTLPKIGMYYPIFIANQNGVKGSTITFEFGEVHHTIDPKYLPNTGGFGYTENKTNILFDGIVELSEGECLQESKFNFIEGETYYVTINGNTYKDIARKISVEGLSAIILGNSLRLGIPCDENQSLMPFLVGSDISMEGLNYNIIAAYESAEFDIPLNGEYALKIEHDKEMIHKIDQKYLPMADDGYGYTQLNKETLFDNVLEFSNGQSIFTSKLNIEGNKTYEITVNGVTYRDVARDVSLEGYTICLLGNSSFFDAPCDENQSTMPFGIIANIPEEDENGIIVLTDLPEFAPVEGEHPIKIETYGEYINKINPKYLPEGSIGYEEDREEIIVPPTALTIQDNGSYSVILNNILLIVGQIYTVYFNGIKYECECFEDKSFGAIIGDENSNTYPFVCVNYGTGIYIVSKDAGIISISINRSIIHYIDPKYLPISKAEIGQVIAVKSIDEIGRPTEYEAVDVSLNKQDELVNSVLHALPIWNGGSY